MSASPAAANRHPDPRRLRAEQWGSPRLFLLLIVAITTTGFLLRLPSFHDSLYDDELSTYFIVTGHSLSHVFYLLQGHSVDLNAPLFYVLAWAADRLGDPERSLRLISLFAGTAAIPLTYVLGLRTVGRRAALVGAALIALSPFLIFFSTEARAYALMLLLALLSTLSLLRALDVGLIRWWVAYAAFSCAAAYTQYAVVFLLGAQFAWAFWTHSTARRPLLAANLAVAVAYIPWLPTLLDQTRSPGAKTIGFLEPFNLDAVRIDLGRWSIGHPFLAVTSLPGNLAIAMVVAGLAAALLGAVPRVFRALKSHALPGLSAGTGLVLMLALATPVGAALYSSIGNSVWHPRILIASSPGLALAFGALVTSAGRILRVAAISLVVGGVAIGGIKMLDAGSQRTDYRGATSFINHVGGSGDPVVVVPAPTPGPLTAFDVTLPKVGQSAPDSHPLLRLGSPQLPAVLHAPPFSALPAPSAQVLAKRAARLAKGGALFVVAPGSAPLGILRSGSGSALIGARGADLGPLFGSGAAGVLFASLLGQISPFLNDLPARFRHTETRTFPGFLPVTVYVFRDIENSPKRRRSHP